MAESIRTTFNDIYLDPVTGLYNEDSQTGQALPLHLGIVPEDKKDLILQALVDNIEITRNGHISTGMVGTLYLLHTLMENERTDLAYEIMTQESYPGYLYMSNSGYTTLCERWTGLDGTRNHLPFASAGVWFYQALAGIRPDPEGPGFKKTIIKPEQVGDLTWAAATYQSVHGTISSDWVIEPGLRTLRLTIPGNTTATVWVPVPDGWYFTESGNPLSLAEGVTFLRREPGTVVCEVGSGSYAFIAAEEPCPETVGMMVLSLASDRNMVSSPFEPYPAGGGTPGASSLDKIIGDQLTGHPVSQFSADRIDAWDADAQTYIMAWLRTDQGWKAWDSMDAPAAFGIDADKGYWFTINNTPKDILFFGHVSKVDRSITMGVGRNMVGSCFPVSRRLADSNLVESGFAGHTVSQWASDKIEFWNAARQTYVGVWYRSAQGWRQWGSMDNPPVPPYDEVIPGEGFWLIVNSAPFVWEYPVPE